MRESRGSHVWSSLNGKCLVGTWRRFRHIHCRLLQFLFFWLWPGRESSFQDLLLICWTLLPLAFNSTVLVLVRRCLLLKKESQSTSRSSQVASTYEQRLVAGIQRHHGTTKLDAGCGLKVSQLVIGISEHLHPDGCFHSPPFGSCCGNTNGADFVHSGCK